MLHDLIQATILALSTSATLMLVTFGVVLIFKTSFTTNFALGGGSSFAAGIAAAILISLGALKTGTPAYIWVPISLITAVVFGFGLGAFINGVIFRYSKYTTPLSMQIVTMGIVLMLSVLGPELFRTGTLGDEPTIPNMIKGRATFGSFYLPYNTLVSIVVSIVVLTVLFVVLRYTKWGLSVRATASNKYVAELMGINTSMVSTLSWAIAGGTSVLGGYFYLSEKGLSFNVVLDLIPIMVLAFFALILGGVTSFYGPILIAFLIPIITSWINTLGFNLGFDKWVDVIVKILILFVMLIIPYGIFGKKIQKKV